MLPFSHGARVSEQSTPLVVAIHTVHIHTVGLGVNIQETAFSLSVYCACTIDIQKAQIMHGKSNNP